MLYSKKKSHEASLKFSEMGQNLPGEVEEEKQTNAKDSAAFYVLGNRTCMVKPNDEKVWYI